MFNSTNGMKIGKSMSAKPFNLHWMWIQQFLLRFVWFWRKK